MKKLMMAAAIVCAAAMAQAATANWKMTAKDICDGTGNDDLALSSGTAYVFDSSLMSQTSLFVLLNLGTILSSEIDGYVTTAVVTDGKITATNFGYAEQGSTDAKTFYFAIVNGDNVYFSNEKSLVPSSVATAKSLTFGSQSNSSVLAATGYQGAGKWSVVPEPTGAMLLLLGVAGLALRRKQR